MAKTPSALSFDLMILKRLLCEQKALQPQARITGMQHERIHQRVLDQVVLLVRFAGEAPAVIKVDRHPGVVVRMQRMIAAANFVQNRLDLDGVDVADLAGERCGNVVAGARADDHDVVKGTAAGVAVEQVGQQYAPPVSPISCIR